MEPRIALVAVTYKDDGPSFAGSSVGALARADVLEVRAYTYSEAERIALKRIRANPMAFNIRARFVRWA